MSARGFRAAPTGERGLSAVFVSAQCLCELHEVPQRLRVGE
jgi:hypothetical protein